MPSILQKIFGKAEQKLPGKFVATATEMEIAAAKKAAMDAERRAAIQAADDRVEQRFQEYAKKYKEGIPLEKLPDDLGSGPVADDLGTGLSKSDEISSITKTIPDDTQTVLMTDAEKIQALKDVRKQQQEFLKKQNQKNINSQKLIDYDRSQAPLIPSVSSQVPEIMGSPISKLTSKVDDIIEGEIVNPQKLIEYAKKEPGAVTRVISWIRNNPKKAAVSGLTIAGFIKAMNNGGDGSEPPTDLQTSESSDEINKVPASVPVINEQEQPEDTKQNALNKLEAALKQPVSSLQEQPKLQDLNVGEGGLSVMEGLKQAQAREEEDLMRAKYGRMGDVIGGAISGQGEQLKDYHEGLEKQAGRHVSRFKELVAAQELDPDSPMSKMFNDYAKRLGFNIQGRMSYAQAKELMPKLAQVFEKDQERQFKGEENKLNRLVQLARIEEAKNAKLEAKELKNEEQNNKFIERRADKLATHAKAYGELRQAKEMINAAMQDPNGVKDVTALYSLIKSLDPASVVREGEVDLANKARGLYGLATSYLSQVTANPRLLNEKVIKDMAESINELYRIAESEYKLRENMTFRQAKARGIKEERFGELSPYYGQNKEEIKTQQSSVNIEEKVKVKENSTGRVKLVSKSSAEKILKNPNYSRVE